MGVCVFTASGSNFEVDGYLKGSPFKPFTVFHQGESPTFGEYRFSAQENPGFMMLVGRDEAHTIQQQVMQALDFISEYQDEFEKLEGAGAERLHLSFGLESGEGFMTAHYWPPELLGAMGHFHIGLVFAAVDARGGFNRGPGG